MKYLKIIAQSLLSSFFKRLDHKRYSISNFYGSSREITTIYEDSSSSLCSKTLLQYTSLIYSRYFEFASSYVPPSLTKGFDNDPGWNLYPHKLTGEHYALLPLLIDIFKAKNICEIGTFHGASSKSMLLNCTLSSLTTFDIQSWDSFDFSFLSDSDFRNYPFHQILSDLSDKSEFNKYSCSLLSADLIFLDAPKNYFFERDFLSLLFDLYNKSDSKLVIVLDDIRVSTMRRIWRSINHPKITLDLIGHWSGTGLVLVNY